MQLLDPINKIVLVGIHVQALRTGAETDRQFIEGVFASEAKSLGVGPDWIELQSIESSSVDSDAVVE